jgi:hypothetical protein
MERAIRLDWIAHGGPTRSLIACAAALPILALMSNTPASWWVQSGFETYPGTFVRIATDNYPLCRPWRDPSPGMHKAPGTHLTTRFGTLAGAAEGNFAVLLPPDAVVTAIYCGAAPPSAPLAECSVMRCAAAAHAQVEDSIFTLGRGVEFSVRSKAALPGQRTDVGFWVFWRPGRPN